MSDRQPTKLTCAECRERLDSYLCHTLSAEATLVMQPHLAWCDVCRQASFARARERVATGEEPLRAPSPIPNGPRPVLAAIRGVLSFEWFPQFYFEQPALAGALSEQPRIHATPDRQFIVELTPLPAEAPEEEPMLEIAVRAHDPRLRSSWVCYRIFEGDAEQPCRTGEMRLDEEGVAIAHVQLPQTGEGPYRFEVEAILRDDRDNDRTRGDDS